MMIAFLLSGVIVLMISLRELIYRLTSYHRFERAEGVIVGIRRKTLVAPRAARMRQTVRHFPVIKFSKSTGEAVTFQSEMGDAGPEPSYKPGQSIKIVYDPEGKLKPMIATWSGVWMANLLGVLAGLVFLAGGVLIYWAFWDRIAGK